MKNICITLIALFLTSMIVAQSPQAFKYQAIARDDYGNILSNWDIGIRISIIQDDRNGQEAYVEIHRIKSNIYGMINLIIGKGDPSRGNFQDIDWGENRHYIKMEMDIDGGNNFREMGTSQLYAVPYALYAEQAGQITRPQSVIDDAGSSGMTSNNKDGGNRDGTINSKVSSSGDSYFSVLVGNVGIGTDLPAYKLDVIGDVNATNFYTNGSLLRGSKWLGETDIYFNLGMVAIGKTTPATALDVDGIISAQGGNSTDWNTAFGWGNHSDAGYLTEFDELDPVFFTSPAYLIDLLDIVAWNTAVTWGDHSAIGYLTSETDPVYSGSPSSSITLAQIDNWESAYGWGDHSLEGYLTSYTEVDPVFLASPAFNINGTHISNWNDAFSWGNHADIGYLTSYVETDPVFNVSLASGITEVDTGSWNESHRWGDHANAGYLTSYAETDPLFGVSVASGITGSDTSNWNDAHSWGNHAEEGYLTSYNETDPKVSSATTNQVPKWDGTTLVDGSIFDNGNVGIGTTSPDEKLHVQGNIKIDTAYATAYSSRSPLLLQTNGTTRIYVDDVSGNTGIGTTSPDASAIVEISSSDKGVLLPSLNDVQRDAIVSPATGLMIYNTSANYMQFYNGIVWMNLSSSSCVPSTPGSITGNTVVNMNATGEVYTIAAVPGASSYHWTVQFDAVIVSGQGTTSITVNFGGISGYVSVRAESGCGNSTYSDLLVTVMSGPWVCGYLLSDIRDGKQYYTIEIGTQCWMAENLNIGTRIDGIEDAIEDGNIEKYCYNDLESNCDVYGGLYQWDEAMDWVTDEGTQGICPDGWHIPTDGEWTILTEYLGGSSVAGGKMKSTGTVQAGTGLWYHPNTGATNESGFAGLPGGIRIESSGVTTSLGYHGSLQTSSEFNASNAWVWYLSNNNDDVGGYVENKARGFSVRCLQDGD